MIFRIRHKTEGWTGRLVVDNYVMPTSYASHRFGFSINMGIEQDFRKPDGSYVEDPSIDSLSDLEIIGEAETNA